MNRSNLGLVAGLLVGLVQEVAAGGVVGLREPHAGFYVGVRGYVPAGTTIAGIRFRSNDETILPRVVVARDGGQYRLPSPGQELWAVSNVSANAGEAVIEVPSIVIDRDQYIWVVVHFPAGALLSAEGRGGGAGIGWRDERVLERERSFFSVNGSLGEFTPALDIGLLTSETAQAKSVEGPREAGTRSGVRSAQVGQTVVFRFSPGHGIRAAIEIFDVAGRSVRSLEASHLAEVIWDGRDSYRRPVASGIYLYRIRMTTGQVSGKFVFVR